METKEIKGWAVIVKYGRIEAVTTNKLSALKIIKDKNLGYLTKVVPCKVIYEI